MAGVKLDFINYQSDLLNFTKQLSMERDLLLCRKRRIRNRVPQLIQVTPFSLLFTTTTF